MWRSKDGSYKKNVGFSSRKYPFRTEQNLSICLTPTEIWFLITCFRLSVWLVLAPIGTDSDTRLKPLNWGQGLQKGLESGLTRRGIQTCTQSLQNVPGRLTRRRKSLKKTAGLSGDTSESQKCKLGLILTTRHAWQSQLPGMQQRSQELMIPGASPLPCGPLAYRLGAGAC